MLFYRISHRYLPARMADHDILFSLEDNGLRLSLYNLQFFLQVGLLLDTAITIVPGRQDWVLDEKFTASIIYMKGN